MTPIPVWRRFALALLTLFVAGVMFHGSVAAALVTRGDDAMRNGDRTSAVRYYRRALAIDASSLPAADRLAFYLSGRRQPGDAQAAIDVATSALQRRPDEPALLADRGFAEQQLGRWSAAQRDFGWAGSAGRDPRYDHLAGRVALRLGDPATARRFFTLALVHDPAFVPARVALAQLR